LHALQFRVYNPKHSLNPVVRLTVQTHDSVEVLFDADIVHGQLFKPTRGGV